MPDGMLIVAAARLPAAPLFISLRRLILAVDNDDCKKWLTGFKRRYITAQGWDERQVKLRIRDTWAVLRDGQIQMLPNNEKLPANALPVFEVLTPGGWKLPIHISERLTGLVTRAMASRRPPREIILGLLDLLSRPAGREPDPPDLHAKRDIAANWMREILYACEDPELASMAELDALWRAIVCAFNAGRRYLIYDLYRDPDALANLVKAQAFQSGRSPDELTRRLEARWLELRSDLGRPPKPQEVAEAAGGIWDEIEECWQFDDLDGLPSLSAGALCDRLDKIRSRHPSEKFFKK